MDEELGVTEQTSVGERLRAAREAKGLSLEDVASETRVPLRHLESLEQGDWDKLPAPTYTIGFAKSYAGAVGLDRAEIGEQLRSEMGGTRPDSATVEHFEPADPARTMPKWVVFAAIAALVAIVLFFTWSRDRELEGEPQAAEETVAEAPQAAPPPAPDPQQGQVAANAPVVLTATGEAWIRVSDQGRTLFEGVLQPGQRYEVPQTATAPVLRAGAPEALRINVGNAVAPPVGPAGVVTSNVSLRPQDLMGSQQAQPGQQPAPQQNSVAQ